MVCHDLYGRPDFDVHPRTIEHRLSEDNAIRDTLVIDNFGGEDVLEWSLEVIPEGEEWPEGVEWLSISRAQGRVAPDRAQRVVVVQRGEDLPEGHHYVDLFFTTNDPTREEYTLPVAGHTDDYPRITTGWPNGWGGWWGIDMNNLFGDIPWGQIRSFQLRIRNPGSAELTVEEIATSNGFWELDTSEFNLDPDGSILVRFIFSAEEVGPNSTTITSVSNAWDPRELDFRIIAAVDPVFRMGAMIPDIVMDEDAGNLLVADLDTVFISSDRGIEFEIRAENLNWELTRSHELSISPDRNWHGITQVTISTVRRDSTLADTFEVDVNPMPDAPAPFDLLSPSDEDTIRWDDLEANRFIWQSSSDVDGDTLNYTVLFFSDDTTVMVEAFTDTSASYEILEQFLNIEDGGSFRWRVRASDDTLSRDSWSVFTNFAVPTDVKSNDRILPLSDSLVDIYPNPFNNSTMIKLNLKYTSHTRLEIFDQLGRSIVLLEDKTLPRGQHIYHWFPKNLVSGNYILKFASMETTQIYQLGLLK